MSTIVEAISQQRIVAILRMPHYEHVVEIAQALADGGISILEFTLSGNNAYDAISEVRTTLDGKVFVGVGTVLHPHEVTTAVNAGAQFIVTPTMNIDVINTCKSHDVPIICGAFTPTEALTAHRAGAEFIKVFPARIGGPSYIRDILAPLPFLRVVPTGGIDQHNIQAYLEAGAVAVGIGSNLVSAEVVKQKNWSHITTQARSYVQTLPK